MLEWVALSFSSLEPTMCQTLNLMLASVHLSKPVSLPRPYLCNDSVQSLSRVRLFAAL